MLCQSEEKIEGVVCGHAVLDHVQDLPAVDHNEEAEQQDEHEDDHIKAGAQAEADIVLPPLCVVDGVHPPQQRLHTGGGRPERQQYGDRQRDSAAVVDAGDDIVHNLVKRLRHIVRNRLQHDVAREGRVLQHGHQKHDDRHQRHEEVIGAGGGIGRYPPAAHAAEEFVYSVIDISHGILHGFTSLSAHHFLTYCRKYQAKALDSLCAP